MKTFREYIGKRLTESVLLEGGNISVGNIQAQPVDVVKQGRQQTANDIHTSLQSLHNSFHKDTGKHLYGEDKAALQSRSTYSGSTEHLFNKDIDDADFIKHKATMGDIDSKIPKEHMDLLHAHLTPGKKFGKYTVIGSKKHGNELSTIMRHENGDHHQFDFEGSEYSGNEPSEFERLAHNSDWHDTKAGVKGAHHKMLLNAIGGDTHKFSITHGLRLRADDTQPAARTKKDISEKLFGKAAKSDGVTSFHGLTQLIKSHVGPDKHQAIYDKFKEDVSKKKGLDSSAALAHLRKHLNVRDSLNESAEPESHTSVVPQVGMEPHSHAGHAQDLGEELKKLPGTKHIGMSRKSSHFSPEEKADIFQRQVGNDVSVHHVSGAGETIRKAHDSLPEGKRHLHILVGHDRKSFAEGLKKSLEAGKVKEMEGRKFDSVTIHYPSDTNRSHGMSGTKMRQAAHDGNLDEYHRHLGPNFSRAEASKIMKKTQAGIKSGVIPLKR
jgi:hypothetical protein